MGEMGRKWVVWLCWRHDRLEQDFNLGSTRTWGWVLLCQGSTVLPHLHLELLAPELGKKAVLLF